MLIYATPRVSNNNNNNNSNSNNNNRCKYNHSNNNKSNILVILTTSCKQTYCPTVPADLDVITKVQFQSVKERKFESI